LQAFFAELQRVYRPFSPRELPPQPLLRAPLKRDQPLEPRKLAAMQCAAMVKPDVDAIGDSSWSGSFELQVQVEVQDSVPVAASLKIMESTRPIPNDVAMRLRAAVYSALGKYRCNGDHLFEQVFRFQYE
jgi:hypothetical protein